MYSNESSAWTYPLAPPKNLTTTSIINNQIQLNWEDPSLIEDGFKIERSNDGENWTQIGSVGVNVIQYTNYALAYNSRYWYRVRTYNGSGNSSYSNEATSKTFALPAPNKLTAFLGGDTQVELRWEDQSTDEEGFKIERSTDGVSWVQIATLSPDSNSFTNYQLEYGTGYHYRIRSYNTDGTSSYSNIARISTNRDPNLKNIFLPLIIR